MTVRVINWRAPVFINTTVYMAFLFSDRPRAETRAGRRCVSAAGSRCNGRRSHGNRKHEGFHHAGRLTEKVAPADAKVQRAQRAAAGASDVGTRATRDFGNTL